ncbi:hypothetical protein L6R52_44255, partial [Myxococcota bacterium]|nr:hypothetical protein [Myxococcota bacterium]
MRLKANDRESLGRVLARELGRDRVFLRGCAPLPPGAPVLLEISYTDRTVALRGRGVVAFSEAGAGAVLGGVELSMAWDDDSRALVAWIVEHAQSLTPHPELFDEFDTGASTGLVAQASHEQPERAPVVARAPSLPPRFTADLIGDLELPPPRAP